MRTLKYYGDPVLRKTTHPVKEFGPWLKELADDMLRICQTFDGLGLAAPQVGESVRLVLIDLSAMDPGYDPIFLANPEITHRSGEQLGSEGCLSFPQIFEDVPRPDRVEVKFQDLLGIERTMSARGLVARAVCHELDHLDGILLLDNISLVRRQLLRTQLKKIQRGEKSASAETY
jgi:peptide deformylase